MKKLQKINPKKIKIINLKVLTTNKYQIRGNDQTPLAYYEVTFKYKGKKHVETIQTEWHAGLKTYGYFLADWQEFNTDLRKVLAKGLAWDASYVETLRQKA